MVIKKFQLLIFIRFILLRLFLYKSLVLKIRSSVHKTRLNRFKGFKPLVTQNTVYLDKSPNVFTKHALIYRFKFNDRVFLFKMRCTNSYWILKTGGQNEKRFKISVENKRYQMTLVKNLIYEGTS